MSHPREIEVHIPDPKDDEDAKEPLIEPSERAPVVNLEGGDWMLTTLLITLDAILLELYKSEDTKWATFLTWWFDYSCHEGWACQLIDVLFVMVVAVANVCLLIPVVNVNVRTPPKKTWRWWLICAWVSLALVDAMTIRQTVASILMYIDDDDDVNSWPAHFYLVAAAVVAMIVLNLRFIYIYGWFSCFTFDEKSTLTSKVGLVQIYYNDSGLREKHIKEHHVIQQKNSALLKVVKVPKLIRFNTGEFLESVTTGFSSLVKRQGMMFSRQNKISQSTRMRCDSSNSDQIRALTREDWMDVFYASVSEKIKKAYVEVAEIKDIFQYSSWIKSAAIFTVLMLFYHCIKTVHTFFTLTSSWDEYHDMAMEFHVVLHGVQGSLTSMGTNLTTYKEATDYTEGDLITFMNDTLPETLKEIETLQKTIESFDKNTGSAFDIAGVMLDVALLTTAKMLNITDLEDNVMVSTFYYLDSIMPILKYASLVGYPIGTLIGLISLYQVLVQHKRMSLALEQALTARTAQMFGKENVSEEDAKATLLGIEKKYNIGGAVYFFGILMSTAVVQQHIFGACITVVIAIMANFSHIDVLLDIGGYLVLVYLGVLFTNLFLTHILGDRMLTSGGFQIKHPWLFFVYLFTFSMVHAVLGFLYALWRGVLLLVTTTWVLNRLDVSLFMTAKQLDNGHYSFMSMLLLTRVIKITNIAQGYIQAPDIDRNGSFSGPETPTPKHVIEQDLSDISNLASELSLNNSEQSVYRGSNMIIKEETVSNEQAHSSEISAEAPDDKK